MKPWLTFDVESAREGPPVAGPSTTVRNEVVGLSGPGRQVRASEVVASAVDANVGSTYVVLVGRELASSERCLDKG